MFDIGATELLMIVVVAVVVIGPKDMPLAMRTAGRWIGKMRKVTGHFRAGIDAMVREAELEEMEKKWREQNEAIMNAAPKLPTAADLSAPTRAPDPVETPAAAPAPEAASAAEVPDAPAPRQSELDLASTETKQPAPAAAASSPASS